MSGQINRPGAAKPRAFYRRFTCVRSEMDVSRGRSEFTGDGVEFIGRIRQRRQAVAQFGAIPPGPLPEVRVGARLQSSCSSRRGHWLFGLIRLEHRIAKAD